MTTSRRLATLPLMLIALAIPPWLLRSLQPHAGPLALPSARPAASLRAVRIALLALALGGLLLWSAPAPTEAQTATVLVKNTGQSDNGADISLANNFPKQAQAFMTGDNSRGYNLTSIAIRFDTISDTNSAKNELTATLNEVSSGNPGSPLCTLVTPDLTSAAANTFAAPSDGTCPVLQPSTSYYVVLDRTSYSSGQIGLQLTTSDDEDDGGAAEWTIDNTTKEYGSSTSSWGTTSSSRALMIEVKGSLVVPPDPTLLVKNTAQTTFSPLPLSTMRAQGFTTGTAPGGYNLTSIGVLFDQIGVVSEAPNAITATINEVSGTEPGTVFCTLAHPSPYVADSVNTYDASGCSTLSPNTPYFVVLNRTDTSVGGTIQLRRTASDNEDGTPATGWSIADNRHYLSSGSWTTAPDTHLIEIRGAAVSGPPKRVTGFDLHTSNSDPRGMWGNGDTFWVVNDTSGSGTADKLYAYNRSDGSRDTTNDFDNLNGANNNRPWGICSDGTTMFVGDRDDDKLYAYKMSDTTADSTKDITLDSGNGEPRGMWCDATTVYVANDGATSANKVFAYTISTRAHDSSKDFEQLYVSTNTAAQNAETPRGVWSNGTTMFVADSDDDNVFAYKHSDESQDSGKNLALSSANDNPNGMWFDGRILWVVDDSDDIIYPYDLPGAQPDNTPADGDPVIGSAFTKDVLTATVTAGVIFSPSRAGYAVTGIFAAPIGSISESEFDLGGASYTVRAVLDGSHQNNSGDLILVLDRALPLGFTFTADGVSYSSSDATESEPGTGLYQYLWAANLSWGTGSSIPVVLNVEIPKDGEEVSADVSGITDSTNGVAGAHFDYQWIRVDGTDETDIDGETGSTYTPTAADVDKHLKVRVVFDDDAGYLEYPLTSPRFGPVVDAVPPTVAQRRAAAATTISILFTEPLDPASTPAASAFAVQVGDTANTVVLAEIGDIVFARVIFPGALILTVSTPMLSRDTITVSYTKPDANPLQDLDPERGRVLVRQTRRQHNPRDVRVQPGPDCLTRRRRPCHQRHRPAIRHRQHGELRLHRGRGPVFDRTQQNRHGDRRHRRRPRKHRQHRRHPDQPVRLVHQRQVRHPGRHHTLQRHHLLPHHRSHRGSPANHAQQLRGLRRGSQLVHRCRRIHTGHGVGQWSGRVMGQLVY